MGGSATITTNYWKAMQTLLLSMLFVFAIKGVNAQNYPVRVTPVITPPYSPFLTDYTEAGSDKLTLQILLSDVSVSNYACKLRLTIEGVNISITTNPNFTPAPLLLHGGSPEILYGSDLAGYFNPANLVYKGITQRDIEKNGNKLPEGIYRFSFEVLDYNRNFVVSNKGSATAWVLLNDPPFINLPANNSKLRPFDPQNVVFQWTPRHSASPNSAFTTEYDVKLVEIWPKGRNPYDAINTSRPIFELTTDATMVVYGPAETPLVLGREYAMQVRARDIGGKDVFKNQGYSEVVKFTYGDECPLPAELLADDIGTAKARVKWQSNGLNTGYVLLYREKKEGAEWFEEHTTQSFYSVKGLRSGTTYEYQVAGECLSYRSTPSPIYTLTTLAETTTAFVCGDATAIPPPDGSPPLPALMINDLIKAGGFDILVTKASGTNGKFTGTGDAIIPWFNNAKVRVTFENITVNKSYQLTGGFINTVWNKDSKLLKTIEQTTAQSKTPSSDFKSDIATFEADTTVKVTGAIVSVAGNSEGDIVVMTNDGSTVTLEKGKSYAIADDVGNGYIVDKDGSIKKTTATDALAAGERGAREYSTDPNLSVRFGRIEGTTKYGWDELRDGTLPQNYQQTANEKYVPWKALATGQADRIKVTGEGTTELSKIKFSVDGLIPQDIQLQANELSLTGKDNGTNEELLALSSPADTSGHTTVVGKVNLVSYNPIYQNLVIVVVNQTDPLVDKGQVQTKLTEVFQPAVTSWNVGEFQKLNAPVDEKTIDDGNSSLLSNYTADMKQVINTYLAGNTLSENTYYLFLVTNSKSGKLAGYMPRSKQAGFIFTTPHHSDEEILNTIAHELGHGAFHLKHTFSEFPSIAESSSDNLMDYRGGQALNKYQWDYIHNPETVLGLFEDDQEGSYETDGHYSTVYLVSLMLGMNQEKAKALAVATEAPDTDIHGEIDFEIDQTWAYPGVQKDIHSLTGGFHGVEEMMTAFKFLYTPESEVETLGELLHRYGDTYAHTRLDNIFPDILKDYEFDSDTTKLILYINGWRDQGGIPINDRIAPWIQYLNYEINLHGYSFLTNESIQRSALSGKTLVQYLHDIYLNQPIDKLVMYGGGFFTFQHASVDKGMPDVIYIRPNWYLTYVKNLAVLLAYKYQLDVSKLDINVFQRMVNYAVTNKCKLKGIIDFEIARKKGERFVYVPVFYSEITRLAASYDAIANTNYLTEAQNAKDNTVNYIKEMGYDKVEVEEINGTWKVNSSGFYQLQAYKIKY